jgi:ATP sulfurylase
MESPPRVQQTPFITMANRALPAMQVRSTLPAGKDVLAFQCRNPIHKAHYELFTRALSADNVREGAVCLVHPTCGPTQVRHWVALARCAPSHAPHRRMQASRGGYMAHARACCFVSPWWIVRLAGCRGATRSQS